MKITGKTEAKLNRLRRILSGMEKAVVAFSGGVDSTVLLKTAAEVMGEGVLAVTASSETYPTREILQAGRMARKMRVRHRVIETHELENPGFRKNPPQRCFFCKKELFSELREIGRREGIRYVLDGSNAEDSKDFRPGTMAGKKLGVRSPLREAGLVKKEIREIARFYKLPNWNKPSLACLASRFPCHTRIEKEKLRQVGEAEEILRKGGFTQVRVRHHGQIARIEVNPEEFPRILKTRNRILQAFKKIGYFYTTLDLAGYRTGSMNEPLGLAPRKS